MEEEKYENLSYTAELRGDVSAQQQRQLIRELTARFLDKPRVCKKVNDSSIGSSKRILYVHDNTFYYYQMIQEFQDLDVGKLEYSIPKAGVKLVDIISLAFPPRKKKEKNYFTITVPKNKILKYGKNKEIVVDPKAKGELSWTFIFTYDIVSLPEKEERIRNELERQKEVLQRQKESELKEKERQEKEERERRLEEEERQKKFESFLQEKEDMKSEGQEMLTQNRRIKEKMDKNEQMQAQLAQMAAHKKRIQSAYEFHFHNIYKGMSRKLGQQQLLSAEYKLLQIVGNFRQKAIENCKLLIDELIFDKSVQSYKEVLDRGYLVNNMWIRLGGKNINQEFLGLENVADILAMLKKSRDVEMRVPLAAFVKYRGFKAICVMNVPIDGDATIIYGLPAEGGFKINSSISDELKDICKGLNLRPYSSQVRFSNITVYLDPRCQVHQTAPDPFRDISRFINPLVQPNSHHSYSAERGLQYLVNIREIFPVDIDLENSINQSTVRIRPEYVREMSEDPLSSGAFLYSIDNADGEVEDLMVAKASQKLRYQAIGRLVAKLDNLDIVLMDSRSITEAIKLNGVNMRYLGKIAKLTELPYVKELMTIEVLARCIKKVWRQQQTEYIQEGFRHSFPDFFKQINREQERIAAANRSGEQAGKSAYMQLKKKEVLEKFAVICKQIAIDFLNLVFGSTQETLAFWQIIRKQAFDYYQVEVAVLPDVTVGALLHAVLYHCDLHVKYDASLKLFLTAEPFKEENFIEYCVESRVYEYPSFEIQKMARKSKDYLLESKMISLGINALNLELSIGRALRASENYRHCAMTQQSILVRLANYVQVKQPECPPFHQSLIPYFIANVTEDNFLKAHRISEFCLPMTHPLFISFYMAYSKLHDPEVLYRSALLVAVRSLGVSHWKTCELMSVSEGSNLESLRKAWISSRESSGLVVLTLIKKLAEVGKLLECLTFAEKGYKIFAASSQTTFKEVNEIVCIAIRSAYQMRQIESMLTWTERLWKNLEAYDRDNMQLYYLLYWFSVKAFLETSIIKKYYYKLILILGDHIRNEQNEQGPPRNYEDNPTDEYFAEATGEQRNEILYSIIMMSRQSKSHLDWIKSILSKLEYGYKTLNFAKNFFTKFQQHLDSLMNEDLEEGIQYLYMLGRLFGQKYFEDALITGIFFGLERQKFVE